MLHWWCLINLCMYDKQKENETASSGEQESAQTLWPDTQASCDGLWHPSITASLNFSHTDWLLNHLLDGHEILPKWSPEHQSFSGLLSNHLQTAICPILKWSEKYLKLFAVISKYKHNNTLEMVNMVDVTTAKHQHVSIDFVNVLAFNAESGLTKQLAWLETVLSFKSN